MSISTMAVIIAAWRPKPTRVTGGDARPARNAANSDAASSSAVSPQRRNPFSITGARSVLLVVVDALVELPQRFPRFRSTVSQ